MTSSAWGCSVRIAVRAFVSRGPISSASGVPGSSTVFPPRTSVIRAPCRCSAGEYFNGRRRLGRQRHILDKPNGGGGSVCNRILGTDNSAVRQAFDSSMFWLAAAAVLIGAGGVGVAVRAAGLAPNESPKAVAQSLPSRAFPTQPPAWARTSSTAVVRSARSSRRGRYR